MLFSSWVNLWIEYHYLLKVFFNSFIFTLNISLYFFIKKQDIWIKYQLFDATEFLYC